tara:strand:- start:4116 stop:4550 length:435 start_codon:yes stop_codon:yes gene_type:complete
MKKLKDILKEIYGSKTDPNKKWWAVLVDSLEDWEILSSFLDNKGYEFERGHTYSDNNLVFFNPFRDEEYFDSHEYDAESDDMGYKALMSYEGKSDFVLLNRPKNKLVMVNPNTFNSRKDSTYESYVYFTNLKKIIKHINKNDKT